MSESIEVRVPDIGDFHGVPVIDVLVKPGDQIQKDDSLITLESEKATMDVPSPTAGTVEALKVSVGDKVSEGSVILTLAMDGVGQKAALTPAPAAREAAPPPALAAPTPSAAAPAEKRPVPEAPAVPPPPAHADGLVHASPSVRRFARELGVDLRKVSGSGPNGRATRDDVQTFVRRALVEGASGADGVAALGIAPWPKVDFAQYGPVELQPLSRIKKISGPNLHRNWVMIPHVTNNEDADITELEEFRQALNAENAKSGVKLTMLAFLIKAAVAALQRYPEFNSSLDGDQLVVKKYYHIGFAADTPNGLVVPVLKDADKKGVLAIAQETAALAAKAREGKLSLGEMQGGTFTISSLGGIGGTYFTPIVNAPEVAILGACRAAMRPVWNGKEFAPRLILPLSLSYDHRVIDGASAARFNTYLANVLADMRRAML